MICYDKTSLCAGAPHTVSFNCWYCYYHCCYYYYYHYYYYSTTTTTTTTITTTTTTTNTYTTTSEGVLATIHILPLRYIARCYDKASLCSGAPHTMFYNCCFCICYYYYYTTLLLMILPLLILILPRQQASFYTPGVDTCR